jgi:FMN phosphatase YigB (HAD superfamily)
MLEMLNLPANDILFVGDTPHHDVIGAKSVGMSAAWIHRPSTNANHGPSAEADLSIFEGFAKPDYVIEDLAELPDVLET